METDYLQERRGRHDRELEGLTGAEYVMDISSKHVSNILFLLFLVIFLFFLSEYIPFNSYKNKVLLLLQHQSFGSV